MFYVAYITQIQSPEDSSVLQADIININELLPILMIWVWCSSWVAQIEIE